MTQSVEASASQMARSGASKNADNDATRVMLGACAARMRDAVGKVARTACPVLGDDVDTATLATIRKEIDEAPEDPAPYTPPPRPMPGDPGAR